MSAGFDAHILDILANLNLMDEDYFWIAQQVTQVAKDLGHNRVVSALEGGYSLDALRNATRYHVLGLANAIV